MPVSRCPSSSEPALTLFLRLCSVIRSADHTSRPVPGCSRPATLSNKAHPCHARNLSTRKADLLTPQTKASYRRAVCSSCCHSALAGSAGRTRVVEPPCGMGVGSFLLSPSGGGLWPPLFFRRPARREPHSRTPLLPECCRRVDESRSRRLESRDERIGRLARDNSTRPAWQRATLRARNHFQARSPPNPGKLKTTFRSPSSERRAASVVPSLETTGASLLP